MTLGFGIYPTPESGVFRNGVRPKEAWGIALSRIFLVRHAQANFGVGENDQLSHLGATQAWMLAEYLSEAQVRFDAVFCGTLLSQSNTVDRMAEVYLIDGKLPAATPMTGLNEMDYEPLLRLYARQQGDAVDHKKLIEDRAYYRAFMEKACAAWMDGNLEASETWPQFQGRSHETVDRIRRQCGRGQSVLVVTSSGVIGAVLKQILGLDDATTVGLGSMMANTSMTTLLYDDRRLSLESFNQRDLVTYR